MTFSHLDESGAARVALVWLLPGMDAGVGLQISRPVELSPADVAAVRLCACKSEEQFGQGIKWISFDASDGQTEAVPSPGDGGNTSTRPCLNARFLRSK